MQKRSSGRTRYISLDVAMVISPQILQNPNAWLLEAREMPILAMFEPIRHELMDWFADLPSIEDNTIGLLV